MTKYEVTAEWTNGWWVLLLSPLCLRYEGWRATLRHFAALRCG